MSRFLLCLLPIACVTEPVVELGGFDPELAEGHLATEHVEVAPGVFLLSEVASAGTVRYVPQEELVARRAFMGQEDPSRPTLPEYCYNYDDQNYADELMNDTMFGSNPSWYGVANAWSYRYEAPGTENDQDYEQVQAYLWSYTGTAIANISATAYVYVNDAYVGYVYANERNRTTALAYAVFDATCENGEVSVEVLTYHSWSTTLPRAQYLYLSNTSTASVQCCP